MTSVRTRLEAAAKQAVMPLSPLLKPRYLVTAGRLDTGAIELITNTENIPKKLEYLLSAYDENMKLKANPKIEIIDFMLI